MDISLFVPLAALNVNPGFVRALGREADERGFRGVWVPEHVVLFDAGDYESSYPYDDNGVFPGGADTGLLEPLTALTYLAACSERIRLGTAICLIPQRNPVYTAKQVADLDVLSGGRVDFGIGVGWLREEFEALNVPFERRGVRADEYLDLFKQLWSEGPAELDGETYSISGVSLHPKPVQSPHPPIHVGGESTAAMRRVARHGNGWFSFNRPPDALPDALAQLDEALAAEGRSREDGDFRLTVSPYMRPVDAGDLERYAELGVDEVVISCLAFGPDDLRSTLDTVVADVLEPAATL